MKAWNPYRPIPDHSKRPPIKVGPTDVTEALIETIGPYAKSILMMPEYDPFHINAGSGVGLRLRGFCMIEAIRQGIYRLTPLGRAVQLHLRKSRTPDMEAKNA